MNVPGAKEMSGNETIVCFASNIRDVLYQLKTVRDLQIVGGCTKVGKTSGKILSIRGINELSVIDKHERFIDMGPAVLLGQMQNLGSNNMPLVLYEAVKSIATPFIRNLATIGGNICSPGKKLTLYAPLLALNSRIELQSEIETVHVPFNQFSIVPPHYILTKIRIPIEEWDVSVFRRLGPAHVITPMSASYTFLAKTENTILTNLRIAFAGAIIFRSQELENRLLGSRLPIPAETVASLVTDAGRQFDRCAEGTEYDPLLKEEFLKLVSYSFDQLT